MNQYDEEINKKSVYLTLNYSHNKSSLNQVNKKDNKIFIKKRPVTSKTRMKQENMIVDIVPNEEFNEKDDLKVGFPSKKHVEYKFNHVSFNTTLFKSILKDEKEDGLNKKTGKSKENVFLIRNKENKLGKVEVKRKEKQKQSENKNIFQINGNVFDEKVRREKEEVKLIGDVLNMRKNIKKEKKEDKIKFDFDIIDKGESQVAGYDSNKNKIYNLVEDKFEEEENNENTIDDNNLIGSLNDMIKYISTNKDTFKNTNRLLKDMYSLIKSENLRNNHISTKGDSKISNKEKLLNEFSNRKSKYENLYKESVDLAVKAKDLINISKKIKNSHEQSSKIQENELNTKKKELMNEICDIKSTFNINDLPINKKKLLTRREVYIRKDRSIYKKEKEKEKAEKTMTTEKIKAKGILKNIIDDVKVKESSIINKIEYEYLRNDFNGCILKAYKKLNEKIGKIK